MDLFSRDDATNYFRRISDLVSREIESFSDEKIQSTDLGEWLEYYHAKYAVTPLVLFEDRTTQDTFESTTKTNNPLYGRMPCDKQYWDVPSYTVTFDIPFDGSPELLELRPSTRILKSFPADVQNPRGESCGSIKISLTFTKNELKDKPDLPGHIKLHFEHEMKSYREMIQYINAEARTFNKQLRDYINVCLGKRKDKASDFQAFREKMNIPLARSENAPNTVPVPLKRIVRTPPVAPSARKLETEYRISDDDYKNINNIIYMFCVACEKTAVTYAKLSEEEIRDTLLSVLNTHYENATGETFRKKGKTDILIEFGNKAGFVAECKIWHGPEGFTKAIDQLFGYITWRDCKAALIIFNKQNKNFTAVRQNINEWIKANSTQSNQAKANMWECTLRKNDSDEYIELTISVYDLYIG